jgi:hypothetical protein
MERLFREDQRPEGTKSAIIALCPGSILGSEYGVHYEDESEYRRGDLDSLRGHHVDLHNLVEKPRKRRAHCDEKEAEHQEEERAAPCFPVTLVGVIGDYRPQNHEHYLEQSQDV